MKITIDTKEDSHEEIKKIISVLTSLVGNKEIMSNQDIFSSEEEPKQESEASNPDAAANMFSMFGDASQSNNNADHSENSVSFEPEASTGTEIQSKEEEPVDVEDILSDTEIKIEPREYHPEEEEEKEPERRVNLGISQLEEYDD